MSVFRSVALHYKYRADCLTAFSFFIYKVKVKTELPSFGAFMYEMGWWWCEHAQSCLTLCDPVYYSPPGSSAHGLFQARILEVAPFPPPEDLPNPEI